MVFSFTLYFPRFWRNYSYKILDSKKRKSSSINSTVKIYTCYQSYKKISTAAFAFGVAEEYILILIICIISFLSNRYYLWIGCFIAFVLHMVIHIFQAIFIKKYIPALLTSLICIPISIAILVNIWNNFSLLKIILYSVLSCIIMIGNLALIHFVIKSTDWTARALL